MPELAARVPFSSFHWRPQRMRAIAGHACQIADLVILGAMSFGLVFLPLFREIDRHASFADFLKIRVSLRDVLVAVLALSAWRAVLALSGIYQTRRSASLSSYVLRCLIALNGCTGIVGFVLMLFTTPATLGRTLEAFWLLSLLCLTGLRTVLISYDVFVRPHFRDVRNLIIVGSGPRARKVYEDCSSNIDWDYRILGFVDSDPQVGSVPPELLLGGIDDLSHILMHRVVDEVVVALPMKSQYLDVARAIEVCQMLGIQAQYFTDHFGSGLTKRRSSAGPQTGRVILEVVHSDYRLQFKRLLDIVFAACALVFLSPVLLITAIAVKLTSPGPILFRQERFGLQKRTFYMLKFRSMCVDAESKQAAIEHLNETSGPAFKIKDDPRVTPIGRFLRRMSIDELPQLWNVLVGEMSLVGPRPLPLRDVNKFSEAWLMRRFSVKPGITCLWQVMGRSNTDFDRWIQLDLRYIDQWSLSLDLLILLKTFPAVLSSRGAV